MHKMLTFPHVADTPANHFPVLAAFQNTDDIQTLDFVPFSGGQNIFWCKVRTPSGFGDTQTTLCVVAVVIALAVHFEVLHGMTRRQTLPFPPQLAEERK